MKRIMMILATSLFVLQMLVPVASANVQNFYFSSFDADYYLDRDDENRSTLRVIERLTAEFPDFDQNKGIIRAIPAVYDGHSVHFKLDSVTRNGQTEPVYDQYRENDNHILELGTDDYVRGTQEYVITYTLQDVTKSFDTHQEFFWDINGTEWPQSFTAVTARVHLSESIRGAYAGEVRCFVGAAGSTASCDIESQSDPFQFRASNLQGGQNMSVVMKFEEGTFADAPRNPFSFAPILGMILTGVGVVMAIYGKLRYGRNHPGRGTIVPQYLPPDMSVLQAAEILGEDKRSVPAQLIDLAVRHHIVMHVEEKKSFLSTKQHYSIEVINPEGLNRDEQRLMTILVGEIVTGASYTFDTTSALKASRLEMMQATVKKQSVSEGYRLKPSFGRKLIGLSFIPLALAAALAIIGGIGMASELMVFGTVTLAVTGMVISSIIFATMRPLTEQGRLAYDYLQGLKMYLKLAEADRLKYLQSPSGAEKRDINTADNKQIIVLYERVLPYAVLLGVEKEWLKELLIKYDSEQASPGWYTGSNLSNAALASSLTGFSNQVSHISAPSSSSSSGFSGGSSGGGGGGGR